MYFIRKLKQEFNKRYYSYRIRQTAKMVNGKIYTGGKSYVTCNTILGNNVCFNGMSMSGNGKIVIGNNFHSGTGCQIITSFHNYEGKTIPYDNTFLDKDVNIEDNVWLGNNVIILGGITIGEGAIIQAGSVVCKDIPAYAIAGGHPARQFKQRNIQHYEQLKKNRSFH